MDSKQKLWYTVNKPLTKRELTMIALYLSPLYLIGNIYICCRALQWLSACSDNTCRPGFRLFFIIIYAFLALSIGLAFILPHSGFQRILACIGTYWLGILLYIIIVLGAAELIRLILHFTHIIPSETLAARKTFVATGLICIAAIAFFLHMGHHQRRPRPQYKL